MATDVVIPEVGETGMDVTLVRWLKAPGDPVAVGDILFELDTDKTVVEVEAWTAGTIVDLRVGPGDIVSPRQVIARILAVGEALETPAPDTILASTHAPAAGDAAPEAALSSAASGVSHRADSVAVSASPRARRLAADRGLDLATVVGTGADGFITERDVLAAMGEGPEDR
jgi:pyruvate/2-oxoglutarate dehydrogenase complex dihydrolipoamide acyltransferase (E2) component